jgi:DNA-binding IclR family transcriptional regulator
VEEYERMAGRTGTQSLGRGLAILRIVIDAGDEGARLRDVVESTGLASPTARRILKHLVEEGLLDQDETSRRYRPGNEAMEFGLATAAHTRFIARCLPMLTRLAEATQDRIYLAVRTGLHMMCIHQVEPSFPIRIVTMKVGDRVPIGIGAGSIALLARLPRAEADRLIPSIEPLFRPYQSYTRVRFFEALEEARATGIGVSSEVINPGISGIGTAIVNAEGRPFASIDIGSVTSRIFGERFDFLRSTLLEEVRTFETGQGRHR